MHDIFFLNIILSIAYFIHSISSFIYFSFFSLVQFNVCIRPSSKFPPHLIIALVNILRTGCKCERGTIYIYIYIYTAEEEEEEETVLCNPFLLTNCLTCVYACSKHISSFLLLHRTLELEHSLFFALIVKNTHIHFQRFHAFFLCINSIMKERILSIQKTRRIL